jgi:hypothetical protein
MQYIPMDDEEGRKDRAHSFMQQGKKTAHNLLPFLAFFVSRKRTSKQMFGQMGNVP